ncbi:MAG: hypothetical protein UT41_C0001G0018 [Candidatus Wolfebacteria bacterium GW2011_GWC2_39_22]|uniref:Uncharacterized protein n=1 Tax=Candidatus Wolfebacteria bacterium GW2011_GWC2_39_22 TaxID=1619013 RepID=A0A0G0N8F9_9BACT|nr:MAG: hypothetical protein UT41_C0001G0018 [Candidatus Wolfebacteria bacterium GW2011_GWC2_39_22]
MMAESLPRFVHYAQKSVRRDVIRYILTKRTHEFRRNARRRRARNRDGETLLRGRAQRRQQSSSLKAYVLKEDAYYKTVD